MTDSNLTNLPAADAKALAVGLAQAEQRMPATDAQFIKLTRQGEWVFGAEDTEVTNGEWAINPQSFIEGFIAWDDGDLAGEEMAPMAGTPILKSDLPVITSGSWAKQIGFAMQCIDGEHKGTVVLYKTSSKGGTKAVRSIVQKVVQAIQNGDGDMVPIVELNSSFYKHKQYGKIYNPELTVLRWVAMDGSSAGEQAEPDPEPEPTTDEVKPKRRRKVAS